MDSESRYSTWTCAELKEELRKRGARLAGRKNDLIKRLQAYDRNDNFNRGEEMVDQRDFRMSLPAHTCYKDVNSSALGTANQLSEGSAKAYFEIFDTSLDDGRKLYDARWLRFLRWAQDDETTFYLGQCWAEMKKTVCYFINISINANGEIMEAECDCAAGIGPTAYCKHIQAVFLAIIDFTAGKQPILELSCTETLQSFHRPKRLHNGSPVKASDLKLYKDTVNLRFDPRPTKYRRLESYPDHVKNLTINFVATTGSKVPLMQTIKPANMYALEHDHDYLMMPHSDTFLAHQNITGITPEDADRLEEKTEPQALCKEWREERKNRIQSSNFGRIMTSVSRDAKLNLAKEMIIGKDFVSKYTAHGKAREPHAIKAYEDMYNVKVVKSGIVLSMDKPYIGASPDGLVGEDIVLEVKCPYTAKDEHISPETVDFLFEDEDGEVKLKPTHKHYAQVQGQMWVTERPLSHFVVHTFKETKMFKVPQDPTYIQMMVKKLDRFYHDFWCPMYLKRHFYKEV